MRRIIILWHILILPFTAIGQSCGFADTVFIARDTRGSFTLNIADFFNDNLADPAQGLCGIELKFKHSYVEEFELSLTSPAGQTINLIGPNTTQSGSTFQAIWDITFVPSSEPAMPDSSYLARWDNNQPNDFVVFGRYSGSYYPYTGDLEDFNIGPVNGDWVFNYINDPSPFNDGLILFARLIFCDSRGVDCCFGVGGELQAPDLLACEGDTSLLIDPDPLFSTGRADTAEYDYTYILARDSLIIGYDTVPDLQSFSGGVYQICGLSYRASQEDSLTQLINTVRLDSLQNNLNSFFPLFCGDLSENCVTIQIEPPPDTVFLVEQICLGDSLTVGDSVVFSTGNYVFELESFAGCDSIVDLDLTVIDPIIDDLAMTICEGDSVQVGSSIYRIQGNYTDTLQSQTGCDSIINLSLEVLQPIVTDLTELICPGDSLMVGDSVFMETGQYQVQLLSARNCDSIVNLDLRVLDLELNVPVPDTINCFNNGIVLDAGNSTPNGLLTYDWLDLAGNSLGNSPQLNVNSADTLSLIITRMEGGTSCSLADTLIVFEDRVLPSVDAGADVDLSCSFPEHTLGGPGTATGPEYTYLWQTVDGQINGDNTTVQIGVSTPGTYTLEVTNNSNGCQATDEVLVGTDTTAPLADAGPDTLLSCVVTDITLGGTNTSTGPEFLYYWLDQIGDTIAGATAPTFSVNQPGEYTLRVTDSSNGCTTTSTLTVDQDVALPQVNVAPPALLNCERERQILDATASDQGPNFSFFWKANNGGNVLSGGNTPTPEIDATGIYELVVTNLTTFCKDSVILVVEDTINVITAAIADAPILTCDAPSAELTLGSTVTTGRDIQYLWTSETGDFIGDTTEATVTISSAATYSLIVLDTFTRCTDTAPVVVSQDVGLPVAEAGAGATINCEFGTVTLDATGTSIGANFSYVWQGPCIRSANDQLQIDVDCPGTYILEVTNTDNFCVSVDSVEVTERLEKPQAVIEAPGQLTCRELELNLSAENSTGVGPLAFSWSGPGLVDGENTATPGLDQIGLYELVVLDQVSQCTDTASVNVTDNVILPIVDLGPDTSLNCATTTLTLGGGANASGPEFVYQWRVVEGNITTSLTEPTAVIDQEGIYRLTIENSTTGCRDSSTVFITQTDQVPFVDAGPNLDFFCDTDSLILQGSTNVLAENANVSWSGPCLESRSDSLSVVVSCPGLYILSVEDESTGCFNTDTMTVRASSIVPIALLPDTVSISCETGQAVLDASNSTFGTYSWSLEGETLASTNNIIGVEEPGLYTFTVTNLDGTCSDTEEVLVTKNCGPAVLILPPDSLNCLNSTVLIDASGSSQGPNFTYEWRGPEAACLLAGADSPVVEVSCPGVYSLIITNTEVMTVDSQTVEVIIDTIPPVAEAGPPDTITCTMPMIELSAAGSSTGALYSYTWSSFSSGEVVGTEQTTMVGEPGSYALEVVNSQNGCRAQDVVQILIDENVPQISFGNQLFPCEAEEFDLEAIVIPAANNYQYEWTGPGIVSGAQSPTVRIDQTGAYRLRILDLDNGCIDEAEAVVTEQDCVPCLSLLGPDTLGISCLASTAEIEVEFCDDCEDCQIQWSTIGGNIQGASNTLGITAAAPGTYILSVSSDLGFTSTLEVVVLDQTAPPLADAGPDRFLTCDSTQVQLGGMEGQDNDHLVFTWTDDTNTPFATSPLVSVTVAGTYTLAVRDTLRGCSATDLVQVDLQSAPPIAEAGPDRQLTCQNNLVVLDGSGSATGNSIIYAWTTDQNMSCLDGRTTSSPIASCPGMYYLEVRDTASGCFSLDSVLVGASDELPNLVPLPDTSLSCGDSLVVLRATIPATGSFGFEWCEIDLTDQAIAGTCRAVADYEVRRAGRYRFRLEDFASGCRNSFVVTVDQDTFPPEVDAGLDETLVCTSPNMQLQATADTLNTTYQWTSLNGSQIDDANTLMPTIYNADTFLLRVTSNLNQCSATDTLIILQDENAPIANAGADRIFDCSTQSIQLTGQAMSNSGQFTFNWSTDDGNFISSTSQLNPVVNQAGTYILTVNDPINQCSSQDAVIVIEDTAAPSIDIAGLDSLFFNCITSSVTLDATHTIAVDNHALQFDWESLSAGVLIGDPAAAVIQAEGVGLYRLLVTDLDNNCRDTLRFTLSGDFEVPDVHLSAAGRIDCANPTVVLEASSNTAADLIFDWLGTNGESLASDTSAINVAAAGRYEVVVSNTTNGCQQTAAVNVAADTVRPRVNIVPPDALDCFNTSITLSGQGSDTGTGFTYQWTTATGNLLTGDNQLNATIDAAGTYVLTVRNVNNSCASRDSIIVEALSNPIVGTSLQVRPPACTGSTMGVIQVDSIAGGTGPYLYALNNGAFGAFGRFEGLVPGSYELHIEDASGCTWTETIVVPEQLDVTVDLGPDLEIKFGEEVQLEAITNVDNIAEVIWTPALGDTLDNPLQQLIVPTFSTKYAVTVIDDQGCQASDEIIILVLERKRYFAPTVFYPNGNGVNDTYTIYGGNDVQQIRTFQIFDRWGNLVFAREEFPPNDPALGWDGTFNGQAMNAAVYVFYAEIEYIDGRVEMVRGDLTLLR